MAPQQLEIRQSDKLKSLIQDANRLYGRSKEIILQIYDTAITEGFTPLEARKIIFRDVKFFAESTIRNALPEEAKRKTNKIVKLKPKNTKQSVQQSIESVGDIANESIAFYNENITELKIKVKEKETTLKEKENYIEALEKELIDKEKKTTAQASKELRIKITVPLVYREILHLKLNNVMYANLVIESNRFIKLESL